jgi:hypothetical protein
MNDPAVDDSKSCRNCIYYELALSHHAVCSFWMVGFDMRGYEPCEEYKNIAKREDHHECNGSSKQA